MLAVAVSPHGFTTALASEASIVPRASHREITLAACLGRVLGAEPQVGCCWSNSHSYSYSFVSHPPLRTGLTSFQLSGSPVTPRFCAWRLCVVVHAEYSYGTASRPPAFFAVERP